MRKLFLIGILFIGVIMHIEGQDPKMNAFITDLMGRMSLEEKIGQLNQVATGGSLTGAMINKNIQQKVSAGQIGSILNSLSVPYMRSVQDLALKGAGNRIPILFGMDVIHGYRTIFPIPLAMSCSWDLKRIEEVAGIAASEATANGISWTFSPMVDIARDPRWGRIAEGSGEDPWLGSEIARALVRGYQGDDLAKNNTMMACVKHFALYGAAEGGRDYNTTDMSRIAMFNDYLPPYKAAIDEGAGSVMTSFNVVDAVPASGNKWLLTELLREQWGFEGFVVTDYTAINEMIMHGMGNLQEVSALALKAGSDMDMVGEGYLTTLTKSLAEGNVAMKDIDRACRLVLEAKYKLGLFEDPYRYLDESRAKSEVLTPGNLKTAREMAARSMVLLKNEKQILPLKKSGTVAVIGPLADSKADMLGTWSMGGDPKNAVSVLDGIKKVKGLNVLYAKGSPFTDDPLLLKATSTVGGPDLKVSSETPRPAGELLEEAVDIARKSDVIVAVLGEPAAWSGEAASRSDISIPSIQQDLLKALLETGKPVVLVLINGRPLTLTKEDAIVHAILEAWAPGTEGGNAVADVLFGDYNPSGKLTTTFPRSVGQIPLYYNHKNTGRPMSPENKFSSKYLDISNDPLYPFGFGLSYTTFTYGNIRLDNSSMKGNGILIATVTVSNTGKYAGEEVVQLYIQDPVASISRPVKELKDFVKIMLHPGESKEVSLSITPDDLKFYNSDLVYDWEPGDFVIFIGSSSRDLKSVKVNWLE